MKCVDYTAVHLAILFTAFSLHRVKNGNCLTSCFMLAFLLLSVYVNTVYVTSRLLMRKLCSAAADMSRILLFMWYIDAVVSTIEENSNVFSLIQMCELPSAKAYRQ